MVIKTVCKCRSAEGDHLEVFVNSDGDAWLTVFCNEQESEVLIATEDFPRLIAQLQETQDEPSKATVDDLAANDFKAAINAEIARAGFHNKEQSMLLNVTEMADHIKAQDETIASMCMREHRLQTQLNDYFNDVEEPDEPSSNTCELPDEGTLKVRIAVVTGVVNGRRYFKAFGASDCDDNYLAARVLNMGQPGKAITSFVTAGVPLPPKPVVHEVLGETEVSDE